MVISKKKEKERVYIHMYMYMMVNLELRVLKGRVDVLWYFKIRMLYLNLPKRMLLNVNFKVLKY